jgi:hypothetical protein
MPKMLLDAVTNGGADIRFKGVQILNGFWGQHDIVRHSGYILAKSGDHWQAIASRVSGQQASGEQLPPHLRVSLWADQALLQIVAGPLAFGDEVAEVVGCAERRPWLDASAGDAVL